MGMMRILDETGDTTITWALDDPATVEQAEQLFARLVRESKIPFARPAGSPAADAEKISAFDPTAEEIVWVRPVAGG
jgi:hypothetical protein